MAEGVRALVAEIGGVRQFSDPERVANDHNGAGLRHRRVIMAQLVDSIWELAGRIGSSGWTILVLWAIVFVYFWWFFARTRYATRTFDERVEGFRPSEVERILGEFSDADRAAYRSTASTADMFYPLLYSITAAATFVWTAPQLR